MNATPSTSPSATHTPEPVSLSPAGDAPVAEMLARAFYEDPMFTFLLPNPGRRAGPLRWFMARGPTMGHRYGLVDTIPSPTPRSDATKGPAGVAVWLRPGHTTPGPVQLLRAGVATLPLRFGLRGFRKFLAIMNGTEAPHHRAVPGPHWYLLLLGTDPTQRRTGVGGALVRHGTARADAAGLPCYLDTMNEANLAFYVRHGFEVVHEGVIMPGGLRTWGLRRHRAPQRAT